MAKLLDKNGAELMASLVNIAAPLKRFMEDEEFEKAWKQATKKGLKTQASDVLEIYVSLAPMILGEKHLKDTLAIVAEVEGTTVSKMLKMNGTEMLGDVLRAYREQIEPFFMRLGLTVGGKQ